MKQANVSWKYTGKFSYKPLRDRSRFEIFKYTRALVDYNDTFSYIFVFKKLQGSPFRTAVKITELTVPMNPGSQSWNLIFAKTQHLKVKKKGVVNHVVLKFKLHYKLRTNFVLFMILTRCTTSFNRNTLDYHREIKQNQILQNKVTSKNQQNSLFFMSPGNTTMCNPLSFLEADDHREQRNHGI